MLAQSDLTVVGSTVLYRLQDTKLTNHGNWSKHLHIFSFEKQIQLKTLHCQSTQHLLTDDWAGYCGVNQQNFGSVV